MSTHSTLEMPDDPAPWTVTSMGNASVLIAIDDALVLTDPFFGVCPGITDTAALADLLMIPALTAIIGSHWAQDHWEIDGFADYRAQADHRGLRLGPQHGRERPGRRVHQGRDAGVGDRRRLTDTVELEVIPEHAADDGMRTNNYALDSSGARLFYGGEVLDVARVERYARTAPPFDAAIGPVNGVRFKGRQLVTTASEMAAVARALRAPDPHPDPRRSSPLRGARGDRLVRHELGTIDPGRPESRDPRLR